MEVDGRTLLRTLLLVLIVLLLVYVLWAYGIVERAAAAVEARVREVGDGSTPAATGTPAGAWQAAPDVIGTLYLAHCHGYMAWPFSVKPATKQELAAVAANPAEPAVPRLLAASRAFYVPRQGTVEADVDAWTDAHRDPDCRTSPWQRAALKRLPAPDPDLNADWTLHLDVDSCYYTGYLRICSLKYRWSGPRDRRWYFAEDDTCFGGGNGGGGGGGHHDTPTPGPNPTPEPTAPACRAPFTRVIRPRGDWSVEPPYPLVDGQDPDRRGFDLVLDLQGGRAERWTQRAVKVCPSGGTAPDDCPNSWQWQCRWFVTRYNDPIVSVQVSMDLSPSSKAWLQDLGRRYYGLQAREVLPATFDVWTGRAMRVRRAWTYHPLDPGVHEGEIVIRTAGTPISRPQEVRVPYEVRVYLKDTTITDR